MTFIMMGAIGALVAAVCSAGVGMRVFAAVVGFVFACVVSWLTLPVLAWGYTSVFWIVLVFPALIGTLMGVPSGRAPIIGIIAVPALVIVNLVVTFSSWEIVSAKDYHRVIGDVPTSVFSEDVSPVDIRTVRTVDENMAGINADRRRGQDQELGGAVSTGDMNIQHVGGTIHILEISADGNRVTSVNMEDGLWWAGPLNHSGFWRWNSNRETTGYLLASATNAEVSYMVRGVCSLEGDGATRTADTIAVDGYLCEPVRMRYMKDGAYFGDNLMRHLYTNGYGDVGLTDASFELTPEGKPYWVTTTYEKTVADFGGEQATGVVIVDPQSGEITAHSIAETPFWVDRIQPEWLVRDQINWWGKYRDGWWSANFGSKAGVKKATDGTSLVLGADGVTYWYTDMQLTSGGEGNNTSVGYVLVNSRTGQARQYTLENGGVTASSAQSAVNNHPEVKRAQLNSSAMILYNVGGVETYFAALKGGDGRPKMYGFVDMRTALTIGVGTTPAEALRDYMNALSRSGNVGAVADLVDAEELLANVLAVVSEQGEAGTVYYLRLDGQNDVEFFGLSENFVELKWVRVGDSVRISYNTSQDPNIADVSVAIQAFDRIGDTLAGE